jgi:hypothetical protein
MNPVVTGCAMLRVDQDKPSTDKPSAEEGRFSAREVLVFIPLLGSALALSYDVGYFTGLDIHLFTLFSVSEHITFALQALPLAIACAAGAVCGASIVHELLPDDGETDKRRPRWLTFNRPFNPMTVASAVLAAFSLFLHLFGVAAMMSAFFVFGLVLRRTKRGPSTIGLLVAWLIFLATFSSFAFGYEVSYQYVSTWKADWVMISAPSRVSILTDLQRIDAKLIRSGDRGVLFQDWRTGSILFLRWDTIKSIETQPIGR